MVFIKMLEISKDNWWVFINKVLYMVALMEYQLMVLLKVMLMVLE